MKPLKNPEADPPSHSCPIDILLSELKKWEITDSDISLALASANDRFVATWLNKKKLSKQAIMQGRELDWEITLKPLEKLIQK